MPVFACESYGKGRTFAFAPDTTVDWGRFFESQWGEGGDNRYFRRFWRKPRGPGSALGVRTAAVPAKPARDARRYCRDPHSVLGPRTNLVDDPGLSQPGMGDAAHRLSFFAEEFALAEELVIAKAQRRKEERSIVSNENP